MERLEDLIKEVNELKEQLKSPKPVGEFMKVSLDQFVKDSDSLNGTSLKSVYEDNLVVPVRSSYDSMGYDFVLTKDIHLKPGESTKIVTGIRVKIDKGWGLWIAPRSGLGSKFRLQIDNTVGLIDGDYFLTDNEGHIMINISNDSNKGKDVILKAGDRFCQGVFLNYGITVDDDPLGERIGGEGSSGLTVPKQEVK